MSASRRLNSPTNSRLLRAIAAGALACLIGTMPAEEDSPEERWLSAYAWVQTGDRLAAANQWPLALGSYLEARTQIEELTGKFPGFEPEVVSYRLELLDQAISGAEQLLTTDEHDVMMKYLDFIESLKEGERLRYARDFRNAHTTLALARSILDEIIATKPSEFRNAVESQHQRLDSALTWLEEQLDIRTRRPSSATLPDTVDWGTTRFVKEEDLPKGSTAPIRSTLFPDGAFEILDDPPKPAETDPKTTPISPE